MKKYLYTFGLLICLNVTLPGYAQVDRNETLIRSALRGLEYEVKAGISIGYSNSRTCEIGLATNTGIPYVSIAYLVDQCTRPRETKE